MKVGGNESATKFFQQNGGSAALNSKDSKTKYQSNAATKYKEELKKRAARDAKEFPSEVVLADGDAVADGTGPNTPSGEPDDFFSSWDKPAIKKPTPPVSRTATPPVVGRTPSPFLNAGASANKDRSPSPLAGAAGEAPKPAASRITHSSALKKTTTGPRKTNVLGAKKIGTTKLGIKKVTADAIDFDEAEKKAKEEAERIEKLGYDPDAEAADAKKGSSAAAASVKTTDIKSPTPVSPASGGYGSASHTREKSASEMERLGMGMGRLGFGQVGGRAGAASSSANKKNAGGFGSVGPIKATGRFYFYLWDIYMNAANKLDEDEKFARSKFGTQKAISSDEYFGKGSYDANALSEAKQRLQGFDGASAISSNAYFGRADEEATQEYGDLESAAKDFVRQFGITAGDDLENLTQVLGTGATKLQGAIRNYLNN